MGREIWICDWKKHEYYEVRDLFKTGYFSLIQVGGSLSSLIRYDSKENAIKDGWKIKSLENDVTKGE